MILGAVTNCLERVSGWRAKAPYGFRADFRGVQPAGDFVRQLQMRHGRRGATSKRGASGSSSCMNSLYSLGVVAPTMRYVAARQNRLAMAILEHAPRHGPGHHGVHLQVHDLTIAQMDRHAVRLEPDAVSRPSGGRGLADAQQQHRIRALAMTEDLEHLVHLELVSEYRNLVPTRLLIEVGREVAEERRQLEALRRRLLAALVRQA